MISNVATSVRNGCLVIHKVNLKHKSTCRRREDDLLGVTRPRQTGIPVYPTRTFSVVSTSNRWRRCNGHLYRHKVFPQVHHQSLRKPRNNVEQDFHSKSLLVDFHRFDVEMVGNILVGPRVASRRQSAQPPDDDRCFCALKVSSCFGQAISLPVAAAFVSPAEMKPIVMKQKPLFTGTIDSVSTAD